MNPNGNTESQRKWIEITHQPPSLSVSPTFQSVPPVSKNWLLYQYQGISKPATSMNPEELALLKAGTYMESPSPILLSSSLSSPSTDSPTPRHYHHHPYQETPLPPPHLTRLESTLFRHEGEVVLKETKRPSVCSSQDFKILDILHQSQRSTIYISKYNNEHCAIKKVPFSVGSQELEILSTLSHPNIIQLYSSFIASDMDMGLVLELAEMDGYKYTQNRTISRSLWLEITYSIASALSFIHSLAITHHDVKPHNLFFCKDVVKLGDWGNACVGCSCGNSLERGTLAYTAPEVLTHPSLHQEIDMYAFGVTLYVFMTGQIPFPRVDSVRLMMAIQRGFFYNENQVVSDYWEASYSSGEKVGAREWELICKLTDIQPSRRLTASQVMSFVKELEKEK